MDKFGLIGYPIAHSPSPALFKAAYDGRWTYDLIEDPDFDTCWEKFLDGYRGINVTIPFKEKAMERVDIVHPECREIGATNLVVKTERGLEAHNSDFLAIKAIIARECPEGEVALVVGYGGAGKAAAAAARACGMDVVICNRTVGKGQDLRPLDELALLAGVSDIMIYTLPCAVPGIGDIQCPCVLEANYHTPVLKGLPGVGKYIPGGEWLQLQAALGYEYFTGEAPNAEALACFFK